MSTNNNNNDDGRTRNFAMAPSSILTGAAIGIVALVLAFSGIAASSIPMAAAQTLEEGGVVEEQDQTATAFFTDDNNNNETGRLSILGALGISVVEGVKVTSIALNEDASEVTVTVSSVEDNNTTTEDDLTANTTIPFSTGDNNNETDVITSPTTTTAGTTPGVTVAAFKTQLDLASLLQGHMMMEKGQEVTPHMGTANQGAAQGDMMTSSGMPMFDIMSFIESLKIGSDIEQEGWTSPVEVTVPVISGDTAVDATAADTTTLTGTSDTEIVIVVVIPFTGETETAAIASAEEEEIEEDNQ